MSKVGIFFGSDTGNTESIAKRIAAKVEGDVFNVADAPSAALAEYDNLIFGSSTMGLGDLQDDWDDFLASVKDADLSGKVVSIFGLGDADSYPDTFVDGVGTIYEVVKDKGCKIVGSVSTDGYDFDESTAVVDGSFVGLPLDEDNQDDQTEARLDAWIAKITPEFI
ncbi:MAG: flavodoxin [Mangrovibacterium sp.]